MGWYNNSWTYRVKLTIDHTKVGENHTDFPAYVDLSNLANAFFSNVKSDGSDIRVTTSDGQTECPIEVVSIDTSGKTGELHTKIPSVSSSVDTIFYIYYGNAGASAYAANATYGSQNVWRSEFSGVYHMNDGADSSHVNDSTSNGKTGTKTGAGSPAQATGKIGKAQSFSTTTNRIDIGDYAGFEPSSSEFAVGTWIKSSDKTNQWNIFGKLQNAGNFDGFQVFIDTSGFWNVTWRTGGANYTATDNVNLADGSWHRVWLVRRSTGLYAIRDGGNRANNTNANTQNSLSNTDDFTINTERSGSLANAGPITQDEFYVWKGTAPTDNWFLTEYNNQNSPSTFYSVGSQELSTIPNVIISTLQSIHRASRW